MRVKHDCISDVHFSLPKILTRLELTLYFAYIYKKWSPTFETISRYKNFKLLFKDESKFRHNNMGRNQYRKQSKFVTVELGKHLLPELMS